MNLEQINLNDGTTKLLKVFKTALHVLIARDSEGLWYLVSRHHIKDGKYSLKPDKDADE